MPRRTTASFAVLALGALAAGPAQAALPLGPRSLDERRATTSVGPGVTWTRFVRGRGTASPWRVNVLTVDRPALSGRLTAVLSNRRIPGRSRVSSMARRLRALGGVNGGYFGSRLGIDGDPVGVLVTDGRLVSEPVGGRAALLVPRSAAESARVARLRFVGAVELGSRRRLLDGVERPRGRVPGCGGRGGDRPTQRPSATLVCTDTSELVSFSRRFGSRTRTSPRGVEAVVRGGVVTSVRRRGNTPIPRGGYVLSGSGDAGRFLLRNAGVGSRPRVSLQVRAGRRRFDPARYAAIMGGGPRLLERGRVRITAAVEAFPRSFGVRAPRTLAGLRADGRILLATIDGRRPRYSLGATLRESARVMRALGARDALNLDGGGSTAMAVRSRLVNRPSDPGGERRVSDGLFVVP